MPKTMAIADDHEILREALASSVRQAGFTVVASVGDAYGAIRVCCQHKPDVLLMDIEMPGRDSLCSIADIASASPSTRVVILTAYCRDSFIEIARRQGVSGYLLKSDPPASIIDSLQRIASGQPAFSPRVSERMKATGLERSRDSVEIEHKPGLTPRELEVLRYIGRGMDNEQMSKAMWLSKRTVERHISRLMDAVDIRDRAGLVKYAYEQGLVV